MPVLSWRPLAWTLMASVGVFLASCNSSGSKSTPAAPASGATATPSPSPTATPTPAPVAASTTYPASTAGATVQLPTVAGYSSSLCYPANNAPAGATLTLTTTTVAPAGVMPNPQPTGTPFLYFEVTTSATVTFTSNPNDSPVTLPASFSTAGLTFYQSVYDGTTGTAFGSNSTGTLTGTSLAFGQGCGTQAGGPTLSGGHPTVIVISHS